MSELDVLLIVPFQPNADVILLNTDSRKSVGGAWAMLGQAVAELEEYLGTSLINHEGRMVFAPDIGEPMKAPAQRSGTAVCLATHLEGAGLRWAAIDPAERDLGYWRRTLRAYRGRRPRTVAVSSTFVQTSEWLHGLLEAVREGLPDAKVILGGYYYSSNSREFLSMPADVLCVGEGEVRLPQIVRGLVDGHPLDGIPGLYVRKPGGALVYTGRPEPLDLAQLAPPDWELARRMDPPVADAQRDRLYFPVESQRGCVFKCEFCTYRTLSVPNVMSAEAAAEAILHTARYPRGLVRLLDATATFPHDRWRRIMEILIERGGSPHPIWHFARVSDIEDETAALMAKAGVRIVQIGQESGDQDVLHLMKKGTHLSQVKPAIAALGKYGLNAQLGFIHGFPGETPAAMQNTRALISSLNEYSQERPTVLLYVVSPFFSQDFAAVSTTAVEGMTGRFGYDTSRISAKRAAEDVLATFIAVSRVPHAPAYQTPHPGYVAGEDTYLLTYMTSASRYELFRWTKNLQRAVAIFLERLLEGTPLKDLELVRVTAEVRKHLPAGRRRAAPFSRPLLGVKHRLIRHFAGELRAEMTEGAGTWTRALLAASALRDRGRIASALTAWRSGEYSEYRPGAAPTEVEELATDLISDARGVAARWRAERREQRKATQAQAT